MLDKLIKFAGLIPLTAIVIYIIGYVSLVSYLQSYGINENIGLDFKVLKLGVLLSIIVGPVIFLSFADFKFGDYTNAEPDVSETVIDTLHDAMGYSIFYSIALGFLLFKDKMGIPAFVMAGFLAIGLILNKIKINQRYLKLLKGTFIIVPFFVFCFMSVRWTITPEISLYFLQLSVFMACAGLRIFNKSGNVYQISKIGTVVIGIFYSATLFGAFIIGSIPDQYGGEKKSLVTYHIVSDDISKLKSTVLKPYLTPLNTITVEEIYQGTDLYYFKTSFKKIVALPKAYIESEEINIPTGYPLDHY